MKAYQKIYNTLGAIAGTGVIVLGGKSVMAATGIDTWKITSNPLPTGDLTGSSAAADTTIASIAEKVVEYLTLFAGIIAVIYLVWSGIQYILSNGDSKKAEEARKGIINAIIGIVIVLSAFLIIRFASGFGQMVSSSLK